MMILTAKVDFKKLMVILLAAAASAAFCRHKRLAVLG